MGYQTDFTGQVTVTPALSADQVAHLRAFAKEHHSIIDHAPRCSWVPTEDGTAIAWNGTEKFYYAELWLEHLISSYLQPHGHVVNGVIEADGEEFDDVWRIEVRDNAVYVVRLLVEPEYEEIAPGDPDEWSDELKALYKSRIKRNFVFAVRDGCTLEVGPAGESGFAPVRERA